MNGGRWWEQLPGLYMGDSASGYIEIPTDQIERFEKDTAPDPAPVKSRPVSASAATPAAALSATASPVDVKQMVNSAGERHQIDPDFINSVIRAESGFNSRAVSKKGAQGLMQLMPRTASQLGVANSFDPNANVEGGTKYLARIAGKVQLRRKQGTRRLQCGAEASGSASRRASLLRDADLHCQNHS